MGSIIWWLIVGLIAGWLTGKIMGGPGKGALLDIIVGLVGAFCGGFLFRLVGFRAAGGFFYSIFVATIGAVIFTWVVRKLVK